MDLPDPYEQVAQEVGQGQMDAALWVRCIAECEGNQERATGLYYRLRAKQVSEEARRILREEQKKRAPIEQERRRVEKEQAAKNAEHARWQAKLARAQMWDDYGLAIVAGLIVVTLVLIVLAAKFLT